MLLYTIVVIHDRYFILKKGDRYHLVERRLLKPNEGREEIELPESELKDYVGSYSQNGDLVITISMKDGKLFIGENNSVQGIDVFIERKDFLYVKLINKQLSFNRDRNNNIISFTIEPDGDVLEKIK